VKRWSILLVPVLVLLLLPTVALAGTPEEDFDRALDQLYAEGYPQALEEYFVSLGTNPELGFRWAGTTAERAVACRTYEEFEAMGLRGVKLEPVPVDVFEFKSASVTAGCETFLASSFGGTPPTGPDGITAEVIYVGNGTKEAFDAAEAAYGPVEDKLVLMDLDFGVAFWMSLPGAEAAHRGAAGVIMTYGDGGYYWYADDALGSFDATYQYDWAPMVYISKTDGDWLRARVKAANETCTPYVATMVCDTDVTLADDGGCAFNVIGTLPGKKRGQAIVVSAHMDAHFRAGMDDTGALVNMISVAKAMRDSCYLPNYDIVFLATAGEEFGYTNCYYDWLTGAWYAATKTHKNWPGKMRAFLGLELMALEGAPLGSSCSEELVSVLDKVAADNPELVPYGTSFYSPVYCWNDQWPFAAEGIPGIRLGTSNAMYRSLYHTNYETIDLVSYDYLAKVGKFLFRTQRSLDCGLLPYDLPARAASLAASVDGDALKAAGADPCLVDDLVCRVDAFTAACDTYEAGKDCITKPTKLQRANNKLLKIVRMVHDDFIALSAWDYTIYPHEQVFWDLELLNAAIAELEKDTVDPDAAATPIWDISQMYYGLMFSYEAFVDDQQRHDPSYYRIAWGAQGQLAPYHDLVAEYDQIYAGDYAGAKASLTEVRDAQIVLLNERLAQMVKTLKKVTPKVRALLY
jgi:hypothetical protein